MAFEIHSLWWSLPKMAPESSVLRCSLPLPRSSWNALMILPHSPPEIRLSPFSIFLITYFRYCMNWWTWLKILVEGGRHHGEGPFQSTGFRPLLAPHFLPWAASKILSLSCWERPAYLRPQGSRFLLLAKDFLNKHSSTFLRGILMNKTLFSLHVHCLIWSS